MPAAQGKRSFSNGSQHAPLPPARLPDAVTRARRYLLSRQSPDGHWVGELEGDTILESEYILLMAFLGREHEEKVHKAAQYVLDHQLPEGGWNNYPEGPVDLSVSVKAYFALKLTGHDPQASYMQRAVAFIRALGGAARCNSFTKFYLALLGQIPYANCPAVPPEMILLPRWAYFNLYAMSSWTRTIVVPLSIFYAYKPVRRLPPERSIAELFLQPPETPLWPHPPTRRLLTWANFFIAVDQAIKRLERFPFGFLRASALKRAEAWMMRHLEGSDGLGAIYPPMIYTVICLRCMGHGDDSPWFQWALKQVEDLMIEEDRTVRLQPCFSPVWDTALTLNALADAGAEPKSPAVRRGAQWLLDREVRQRGDWSLTNPKLEPGGWFFEYNNPFYPDTDDTAMVLIALAKNGQTAARQGWAAAGRAVHWLRGMQNRDGGWAAFDRDIDRQVLTRVPFADHNAMLDPSCPDITARVLEALGHFGHHVGQPHVQKAIAFLRATQERFGAWVGRWGVNYIYGTWQVLTGLQSIGYDMNLPLVRRAVAWLKQVQQPGGGWGETCQSYDEPRLAGQGTPTSSQTAWALLGLLAAGESDSPEVRAGIQFLLDTQKPGGGWQEEQFTGTGFPKVFYLKYHMYSLYFPLMALARYAREVGEPLHSADNGETRVRTARARPSRNGIRFPRVESR
jgi:squalene-hopene/tetraprenyl-beta-curcumene cyclase